MKYNFQVELRKTYCNHGKAKKSAKTAIGKLKKSLVLAHQLANYMDNNSVSFEKMSQLAGVSVARISQIMSLLFLAPSIQEKILLGSKQNMQKFAVQEIRKIAKIVSWDEQEKYIKMLIPVQI